MKPPLAFLLSAFAVVGVSSVTGDEMGRGHQWVRSHPFTTMALTIIPESYDPHQYKAANMTTTLAWKQRTGLLEESASVGLPWHLHLRPVLLRKAGLTDELKGRLSSHYETYPGCTGWLVWDEPNRPSMHVAAEAIKWLKETYPETLVYSNAFPRGAALERYYGGELPETGYSYEQYLRDFATITDSDVVMYDAYIFREGGGTSDPFPTMMTARKVAQATGRPYWTFVQSHADEGRGYRMPSESDIRMQVFAHLTSGYTGIGYFTYEDQQGPAMVSNATRERRPIYYHVARLNQEVINLGQALRVLDSTGVRYLAGKGNDVPEGLAAWEVGAGGSELIEDIAIKGDEPSEWRDLLIGSFKDDVGNDYFMLTNLWHGEGSAATDRALSLTVTFGPSVQSVSRLSRETGHGETLALTDSQLQLTLPGGTGDLFRFGKAVFPGIGPE